LPGSGLAATALAAAGNGELAQNVVLHERKKLVDALVLVMVRIDIDDQDIIELALLRLFPGAGGWYSALRRQRGGRDRQSGPLRFLRLRVSTWRESLDHFQKTVNE
jgi:hypothetical protein